MKFDNETLMVMTNLLLAALVILLALLAPLTMPKIRYVAVGVVVSRQTITIGLDEMMDKNLAAGFYKYQTI